MFFKIAGILLGPSGFGNIPGFTETFFPKISHDILKVMADVGLIFFMFLVGMELDPDVLRAKFKTSVAISTIGVIVPFACSIPVSWLLYNTDNYALESR
jgi:Kef-type K+ transport system membrane component KefB